MDRRTFTKQASVAAIAATLPYSWIKKTGQVKKIGIQLYTVREQMEEDPKGTLRKLAEMGYQHVESAGYKEGRFYGMKPNRFKKFLDKLGMEMHSGHCKTGADSPEIRGTIYNDWEMAVADAAEVGQQYLTLGYLQDFERTKIDDYKMLSEKLNKAGEICKQYGIQFAYHNHDFEFFDMDNELPYNVLLEEVEEANMKMELDLYWINKAGKNPFDYFKNHPGRFPLWHVKDMDDTEERYFTEVGNGVIDWAPIFQELSTAGMQHFYVEQDHCRNHHPLESVKISYDYLTKMEY